ncbi:MAG TPA: malto-oligosyltrehalose trehalohydrolase [Ensifer sp.]|uniref:malto-oligosyltrehalose trehalohydrolase n=1 Tax=Ensifer sp. TaxID=1872086 RepID=UPI002E15B667|nr:malto-oligosyltrehalose trehalohydrolase [Ensifer sp.]
MDQSSAALNAECFRFGAWRDGEEAVFRIWAPAVEHLAIEIDGAQTFSTSSLGCGWFEYRAKLPYGTRYRYLLPDGTCVADPASRQQHDTVHGHSVVAPPHNYRWRSNSWRGRPWQETILYELHVGLCGGFVGVEQRLPELAALGVTAIELMPVADFPGQRSWGYDGVLQFAPAAAYGTPAELKRLVDRAHELGLSVFLDVVFNHFGPDGCYLHALSPEFFKAGIQTPWGAGIDFDRPEVRAFYRACALQWLDEYQFDGLRFDAVHAIPSPSFLLELEREIRQALPAGRHIHLVVENEENEADLLTTYDAQWNDDFHHAVHVLLTGETTTYYSSFAPEPIRHLARVLESGFAFQGEVASSRGGPRGTPSGHLPPRRFINCLQNHDQIGNRLFGERLLALADPAKVKVATALLLICPQIPMIFMGEEIGSRTPFYYFTDHGPELAQAVREGRQREFAHQHNAGGSPAPDPNAPSTFDASRPKPGEDAETWRALYCDLIALRQEWIVPTLDACRSKGAEPLGPDSVKAHWDLAGRELTLLANFGAESARTVVSAGRTIASLGDAAVDDGIATLNGAAFLAILSD